MEIVFKWSMSVYAAESATQSFKNRNYFAQHRGKKKLRDLSKGGEIWNKARWSREIQNGRSCRDESSCTVSDEFMWGRQRLVFKLVGKRETNSMRQTGSNPGRVITRRAILNGSLKWTECQWSFWGWGNMVMHLYMSEGRLQHSGSWGCQRRGLQCRHTSKYTGRSEMLYLTSLHNPQFNSDSGKASATFRKHPTHVCRALSTSCRKTTKYLSCK